MVDSYEVFKTKILQLTRIDLNAYKERQMKRRIDALISKNRYDSYDAYVNAIKGNKELFDEFVNYLTINVSEFWRNPSQWTILEKEIVPALLKKSSMLKVWSAACSTGDEPYSLVMLLANFMPLSKIRIIATDIDNQVLDKARMGLYNDKSLKGLPAGYIDKYFDKINSNTFQIKEEIKRCVDFKTGDLLKDAYPMACDLILCRNVLIYFTDEAKDEIFAKFRKSLKTEGVLLIGSTEQMNNPSSLGFKSIHSFFYEAV